MRQLVKQAKRGFTLVELMIVVAIVGVLAALAIYGVNKYVNNAKTTEARTALGRIAKDAATAYHRPKASGAILTAGNSAAFSNELCPSATPVPATVPAAAKFQSNPNDWNHVGWACLRFSMTDPQQYQYNYTATVTTGSSAAFEATAQGDLDGDTALSTFTMRGAVSGDTLLVSPNIEELNPLE